MTSLENETRGIDPRAASTAPGLRASPSKAILLTAALAAGFLATSSLALPGTAEAQTRFFGRPQVFRQAPPRMRMTAPRARPAAKPVALKAVEPETKPQGPLTIVISIAKQRLTLYDANGVFAESPVSTGMAGHSTPMGIFSVIEKDRFHRSNIYSNAPMPFMQRITWSGVALHEGMLPGYPASHGCIRMPAAFANKMWGWTKLGARVVIVPDEIPSPREFSSQQLIARIVIPEPETSKVSPAMVEAELQIMPAAVAVAVPVTRTAAVRTADASDAIPAAAPEVKFRELSDEEIARRIDAMAQGRPVDDLTIRSDAVAVPAALDLRQSVTVTPEPAPRLNTADAVQLARTTVADAGIVSPVSSRVALPPAGKIVVAIAPGVKPAVTDAQRKRSGQIAAFISRKERKLYVRQAFQPLFEMPIEITDADKPIGTHLFTARTQTDDAQALNWTAMTMPELPPRRVEARNTNRKVVADTPPLVAPIVPDASEALARIKFPREALARISALMSTGGSLIISDKGIGDETGKGTDFIIPLR